MGVGWRVEVVSFDDEGDILDWVLVLVLLM